jgi:surfeit locus 1 family protein
MLLKLRQAGLIWPTAFTVAGLAVLIGLGNWQLQRKRWKEDLIAKIGARVGADPLPLSRATELLRAGQDVEYMHVAVSGRFHHDKERYLYAPAPSGLGWHVLTPLEWVPSRIVWINRGFVPDARKSPAARAAGQTAGETQVRGLVRVPQASAFTPSNDSVHNLWYWSDIPALTQSAFGAKVDAASFLIEADVEPSPPGGLPQGGVTRLAIPNRHLEYALTWYGLGLTLIGVYCVFAFGRLRQAKDPA